MWYVWSGLALLAAYLFGSFPTGYLAGRLLKGIDIRDHGSKSIGATNVLRTLGKWPALAVLILDALKGVAAVLLARWLYSLPAVISTTPADLDASALIPWAMATGGLAAILGHSKSVWLNFAGGKSVATGLGVLLALSWQVGLLTLAVFGVVLAITRIVSISSITAAIASTIVALMLHAPLPMLLITIAGGLYVVVRHRANIGRLLEGTEPRLGQRSES
ncbi:glycerol-3-phosphate acyltransferase [Microcoleus sp. FACHB-1515]|uniref:glycerol-3-phosphate 1-O-acyltransferase PlsY n=1 Tax=Leptolyngbya sp. FACHB-1515 TaxID=2933931 RepID=UPI0016828CF7|nr:glycerol-3-phosphate 1-O-acyltransferase PlsY [Microcoleus sp. FACHB-1515]MBD2089450.1 glycerol-3-phosphate acyltransferase [Microcoleus sp. FACHB-1515]